MSQIDDKRVINATLGFVFDKKGQVLLIHHNKDFGDGNTRDLWNGIGGKLEKTESPEEGIIREAFEEAGLTIKNPKLSGIMTFPNQGKDTLRAFLFKITEYSGEIRESTEGELKWVPIKDFLKLDHWPADDIFLPWFLDDKFFSAKFIEENGEIVDYSVVFH